jgi:hypothetical protein
MDMHLAHYDENYHANIFFICLSFNLFIIINKPLNRLLHIKGIPHQFSRYMYEACGLPEVGTTSL